MCNQINSSSSSSSSLLKLRSRNKSENYRPVSLLSVSCILLEKTSRDHMVDFLVKHNLIKYFQHDFLKSNIIRT